MSSNAETTARALAALERAMRNIGPNEYGCHQVWIAHADVSLICAALPELAAMGARVRALETAIRVLLDVAEITHVGQEHIDLKPYQGDATPHLASALIKAARRNVARWPDSNPYKMELLAALASQGPPHG